MHCSTTTPTVAARECSSRRKVAIAATQGVYSSVKSKKLTAASGVNSPERIAGNSAVPVPVRTDSVLTTASFAVKPEISEVATRQSPKPSGRKTGAIQRPMSASRLAALSETTFSRVSKVCKNQMMMVARKMTVNARSRKSRAFSHRSRNTLFGEGSR